METTADKCQALQALFSDWDEESCRAILEANNGNLEQAVESLLQLNAVGTGAEPAPTSHDHLASDLALARELSRDQSAHEESDLALARELSQEQPSTSGSVPRVVVPTTPPPGAVVVPAQAQLVQHHPLPTPHPPTARRSGRGRPVSLPRDFLTLPGQLFPEPTSSVPLPVPGAGDAAIFTDEQLAMLLQNELFLRELQSADAPSGLAQLARPNPRRQQQQQQPNAGPSINDRVAQASRAISTMGEGMKRRLNEMAVSFQSRAGTPAQPTGYVQASMHEEDMVSSLYSDADEVLHRRPRNVAAAATAEPLSASQDTTGGSKKDR